MKVSKIFALVLWLMSAAVLAVSQEQLTTVTETISIELPDGKGKVQIPEGLKVEVLRAEDDEVIVQFIDEELSIPISKTDYQENLDSLAKRNPPTPQFSKSKPEEIQGFGNALKSTGDTQIVFSNNLPELDEMTIEAWINIEQAPKTKSARHLILSCNNFFYFYIRKQKDETLALYFAMGSAGIGKINFPKNQWVHVAAVWDGDSKKIRLFYNGNQVDARQCMVMSSNDHKLVHASTVKEKERGKDYFHYQLDEVRIWNKSLNREEIRKNFQKQLVGSESGLIGYYNMDLHGDAVKQIPNLADAVELSKYAEININKQSSFNFMESFVPDPTKHYKFLIKESELIDEGDFIQKEWDELSNRDISEWGKTTLEGVHPDKWKHGETRHFIVHYVRDGDRIARRLEESYRQIKDFMGQPEDLKGQWKSHIYAIATWQEWELWISKFFDSPMAIAGLCRGQEFFLPARDRDGKFDVKGQTLTHEMSHLVMNRLFSGRLASWLNEGIAEYFSEAEKMSRRDFKRRMSLGRVKLDLKKFTSNDYHFTELEDSVKIGYYREAAILVNFLVVNHGEEKIPELVEFNLFGGEFADAATKIFDYESFEALEVAYKKYKDRHLK
ncbi:MAG: LamG domain-containing protein [Verrucomicrobiota bacterium]